MQSLLSRLSLICTLAIVSSCTLQITQTHYPEPGPSTETDSVSGQGSEDRSALLELDSAQPSTEGIDRSNEEASTVSGLCDQFIMPDLGEMPELPFVPPEKRGDDEYVSNLLVDHVNRLSEYIEQSETKLNQAYQRHLETCR